MEKSEIKSESVRIAKICHVLGNAKATEILLLVWNEPQTVKALSESIGMSLSRTSRLVDMLEKVDLVKTEYRSFEEKRGIFRIVIRNLKTLKLGFV